MITPNSEIRLLAGVPLDPTYQHTLYWESAGDQRDAMGNFSIGTFGKQYYQRVSKNTLRLKTNIAAVYQANYMMFKNAAEVLPATRPPTAYTGYPDKWFYAFVLNVEYVNEQVVEITYEIDVIQTWFFQIKNSLKPCFIERQHTETDVKGEHRVPEPVKPGEFWFTETKLKSGDIDVFRDEDMDPRIIICSTFKKTNDGWDFSPGGFKAGMYTGININIFSSDTEANTFINDATDEMKSEGLVCCYQLPKVLAPAIGVPYDVVSVIGCDITKYDDNYTPPGWAPKNNKLYSYPYYGLYVVSSDGKGVEYNMEDFNYSETKCYFDLLSVPTAKPEIALIPKDYKRKRGDVSGVRNYNEMIMIENVPYCAFAIDSFKAWIAQNKVRIVTGAVSDAASIAGSAALGVIPGVNAMVSGMAMVGSITHGINSTINTLGEIIQASKMPPQLNGQQNSSLLNATKNLKFRFYIYYLQQEYMEMVDDFFTMYGYAIKKIAVPNLKARSKWTYIKTNGCNIRTTKNPGSNQGTSIPAQDIVKIKNIFDNGITFWVTASEVGNYNLDNATL